MRIEWDRSKARRNVQKHGVSFNEAATVLLDELSITDMDPHHADSEDRFLTVGRSAADQLLIVAHADRGDAIRIISARRLTRHERRVYESRPDTT